MKTTLVLSIVLLVSGILAGCGGGSGGAAPQPVPPANVGRMRQLQPGDQFTYAYTDTSGKTTTTTHTITVDNTGRMIFNLIEPWSVLDYSLGQTVPGVILSFDTPNATSTYNWEYPNDWSKSVTIGYTVGDKAYNLQTTVTGPEQITTRAGTFWDYEFNCEIVTTDDFYREYIAPSLGVPVKIYNQIQGQTNPETWELISYTIH